MSPQFVDFDGDGVTDIFCGTFDGSPHVAYGGQGGFVEPMHVLDSRGERVTLDQFWNYDTEEWDAAGDPSEAHSTSALAWDWDADGDLDILMGDYRHGTLWLRLNRGDAETPVFDGPNVPVEVAGTPLEREDGLASFELVDWDGDGLEDLVCGGYGDPHTDRPGGAIVWCRNAGKRGEPRFEAPRTLIPFSLKTASTPTRPDSGLHVHVVDWDGDGRLDLLVGGYAHWTPVQPELSAEQTARADELADLLSAKERELERLWEGLGGLEDDEFDEAYGKLIEGDSYKRLQSAITQAKEELDALRPGKKHEGSVWVWLQENGTE